MSAQIKLTPDEACKAADRLITRAKLLEARGNISAGRKERQQAIEILWRAGVMKRRLRA